MARISDLVFRLLGGVDGEEVEKEGGNNYEDSYQTENLVIERKEQSTTQGTADSYTSE